MSKSQSAMEYLMTYGWAILIIAVVLGAIYSLGLFNGASLAPRAQPGSCQVYRPNGPGTVQYVSLAGSCTNQLPQYVAQFNGATSNVLVPYSGSVNFVNAFTVVVWIYPLVNNTYNEFIIGSQNPSNRNWKLGVVPGGSIRFDVYYPPYTGGEFEGVGGNINPNGWYQIAATFNNTAITVYKNGVSVTSITFSSNTVNNVQNPVSIGQDQALGSRIFNGSMANMQLYNSSLDANSVKALYLEGIGGAPINLQSLVGWWPLNGNANDYSGDLNNGQPSSIIYINQWLGPYKIP